MVRTLFFFKGDKSVLSKGAYSALNKFNDVNLKYISEVEAISFKTFEKDWFFIFSDFGGPAFQHLRSLGMHILHPSIIMFSINKNVPLPICTFPLMSRLLKDIKVSCTGFNQDVKKRLFDFISMMGGTPSFPLTDSVKVLVVWSVESDKYLVAVQKKLICVQSGWIDELWNKSTEMINVNPFSEYLLDKYKVSIFFNLKISLTGFSTEEKEKYGKIIDGNGGKYLANLEKDVTTHLVAKECLGNKYFYAKDWGIPVIRQSWLDESVERGCCQKIANYSICNVNENDYYDILDEIDEVFDFENEVNNILESYVFGFDRCAADVVKDVTNKIQLLGGKVACRYEKVTHIIVDAFPPSSSTDTDAILVKPEWITECFNRKMLVSVDLFLIDNNNVNYCCDEFASDEFDEFILNEEDNSNNNNNNDNHKSTCDIFSNLKIAFKRCDESFIERVRPILIEFGGELVDIQLEQATHLVIGAAYNNEDVAEVPSMDINVVKKEWLIDCIDNKRLLPLDSYRLSCSKENKTEIMLTNEDEYELTNLNESDFINDKEDTMKSQFLSYDNKIFHDCNIAFKNCSPQFITQYSQKIEQFGGSIVDVDNCDNLNYVIVENVDSPEFDYSKYVCVDKKWLEDCLKENKRLSETNYLIFNLQDQQLFECFDDNDDDDDNNNNNSDNDDNERSKDAILINSTAKRGGLFEDGKFFLTDGIPRYQTNRLLEAITSRGGQIHASLANCNYIITTVLIEDSIKHGDTICVVTDYYIFQCIAENKLLDRAGNFLYVPMIMCDGIRCLFNNFVFYIMGYCELEKEELTRFCRSLGGTPQEVFVSDSANNFMAKTTHVICGTGNEQSDNNNNDDEVRRNIALSRVPVVSKDWLADCVRQKKIIDGGEFKLKIYTETTTEHDSKCRNDSSVQKDVVDSEVKIAEESSSNDSKSVLINISHQLLNILTTNSNDGITMEKFGAAANLVDTTSSTTAITTTHSTTTMPVSGATCNGRYVSNTEQQGAITQNGPIEFEDRLPPRKRRKNLADEIMGSEKLFKQYTKECCMDMENVVGWKYVSPLSQSIQNRNEDENDEFNETVQGDPDATTTGSVIDNNVAADTAAMESSVVRSSIVRTPLQRIDSVTKIFVISRVDENSKSKYKKIIEHLNGILIDRQQTNFDERITHFICQVPSQSEKFLCALAVRCWILHPEYLSASLRANRWLPEDGFQWSDPTIRNKWLLSTSQSSSRELINGMIENSSLWRTFNRPPFNNWRVVLVDSPTRMERFRNILMLGGAEVLSIEEGLPPQGDVNHAFLSGNVKDLPNIEFPYNYKWMKFNYISEYLASGPHKCQNVDRRKFQLTRNDLNKLNSSVRKRYCQNP